MNLLRDESKKPTKFAFDLEKEIRERPNRGKEILEKAEKQVKEIKDQLRAGANEKDYHDLDVLLHGYTALQKVIKKVMK